MMAATTKWAVSPFPGSQVKLTGGVYDGRHRHNVSYLRSLENESLLQSHYIEAGINKYPNLFGSWEGHPNSRGEHLHWGWETPGSAIRGQFLGHWMSAAAHEVSDSGDAELSAKLHAVVEALEQCQREHGGEWVFSIPPLYFDHLAQGKANGVPQYVAHKTLMGLVDAYQYGHEQQALNVARRASAWLLHWSKQWDADLWDSILDVETGGMIEIWADLLQITQESMFAELLDHYWHHHLFDPLLRGEDVLTNRHANTTIPEAIGAARAYEVTGEQRWRDVALQYWRCAVENRGTFATGGYNSGEIWCPPFEYAARRGDKNQELCTVYNMMRLAEMLFRWTGDVKFMDYYECGSINGILAQTHPETGMPAYYLPLIGGGHKLWGSATCDFWCCHGSVVQANALHNHGVYYSESSASGVSLLVARFIDADLNTCIDGVDVGVSMVVDGDQRGDALHNSSHADVMHRPHAKRVHLVVRMQRLACAMLRVRIPSWSSGPLIVHVDGDECVAQPDCGFFDVSLHAGITTIDVSIPQELHTVAIPDERETVAFMDGPVVLAGVCDREKTLYGDIARPDTMLAPLNERQWDTWMPGYRTVHQSESVILKPLYEIEDERYCVYFPIEHFHKE